MGNPSDQWMGFPAPDRTEQGAGGERLSCEDSGRSRPCRRDPAHRLTELASHTSRTRHATDSVQSPSLTDEVAGPDYVAGADDRAGVTESQPAASSDSTARLHGGAAFRWETAGAHVLVLAALGCASIPTPSHYLDRVGDLHDWVEPSTPIGYRGCDPTWHYFCTTTAQTLALPKSAWRVTELPVQLGWCIPLVLKNERLVVPDREWSNSVDLDALQWAVRE